MAELSISSRFDSPRLRIGKDWTYSGQACLGATGASVTFKILVPRALTSGAVMVRLIGSNWAELPDDMTDPRYVVIELGPLTVEPWQCINFQVGGTAENIGSFDFHATWAAGNDVTTVTETLTVIANGSLIEPGLTRAEGVTCLGIGDYRSRIVARATPARSGYVVGEIDPYSGNWARLINSTSEASVRVALVDRGGRTLASAADSCDVLNEIQPLRHELEIYRDNQLVWAGPILNVQSDPRTGQVDISAKDLSVWWTHRFLLQDFAFTQVDLATIFETYVNYTQNVDPYGLVLETVPTGVLGDRTVAGATVLAASGELQELARTGVDWTICNRRAYVGGTTINGQNFRIPTVLKDDSFRDPPITRRTGTGMGNDWYIKGHGVVGRYTEADNDGVIIMAKRTEDSIEDQNSANASAKSSWDRTHNPIAYLEGDNALDPKAEIAMQEIVPGVEVPVNVSGGGGVPINQVLRLQRAAINFNEQAVEEVTIYLQPVGSVAADE